MMTILKVSLMILLQILFSADPHDQARKHEALKMGPLNTMVA